MSVPTFFPWVSRIGDDPANVTNGTVIILGSGGITATLVGQELTIDGAGAGGGGDVVGPANSGDGEFVLFDSTSGKSLKRPHNGGPLQNQTTGEVTFGEGVTIYNPLTLINNTFASTLIYTGDLGTTPTVPAVVVGWIKFNITGVGNVWVPYMQ